ncbi:hypothetical protein, partial [Acetobacterium sp.]|uniref:hypothetical protein n=1 Tax=Acetobacterium sp. TaxID=1872094 RepID=UPI002F3EA106
EVSFRKKIEESADMSARLEQERDTYMNICEKNEESNREIQQRMNTISKEKEELTIKLQEREDGLVSRDDLVEYESIVLENEELKKQLDAYKKNIHDYAELNKQLNQLKATVKDLNTQIEDYEENEATQQSYDIILAENEIIKQKYEEAVYESSMALAEKESFIEQNKRISDSLIAVNENNKELRNAITTSKLKTRKMIAEFKARAYECEQNHRKNIDEIAGNISNTLKILHNENKDIANLISSPFEEFEIETEDTNEELGSTASFVEGLEAIATLTASLEKKLLSKKKH